MPVQPGKPRGRRFADAWGVRGGRVGRAGRGPRSKRHALPAIDIERGAVNEAGFL